MPSNRRRGKDTVTYSCNETLVNNKKKLLHSPWMEVTVHVEFEFEWSSRPGKYNV